MGILNRERCLKELDDIEKKFSELIENKLSGYSGLDRVVTTRIINDAVDLIKDICRDIYMFDLSYDNYNNGISFMPQYYFENIVLHDDMIWERILIIIALAYQIDFQVIFKEKRINALFDIIKKNGSVETDIKKILKDINADYKMKELKGIRNINEHYISTHLSENNKNKMNLKDVIFIKNGRLYGDIKKIDKQTKLANKDEMTRLKDKMINVSKKQEKYIELLKLCITQMERAFKNNTFIFQQKEFFLPNHSESLYIDKNVCEKCWNLEKVYVELREKLRTIIDMINESVFPGMTKSSYIRNTLLIDSLFRAKEIIRSINQYFNCTRFYIYGNQFFEFEQKNDFKKYICNEVIFSYYYYDHAILKLYSVYEKIAKFLLCKYDFKKEYLDDDKFKGMYINKVRELFSEKNYQSKILKKFEDCISRVEYKKYEKIRNREYHCLRTYYVIDEGLRDNVIISYISLMAEMMKSLSDLFFIIINEEEKIYTKMIQHI